MDSDASFFNFFKISLWFLVTLFLHLRPFNRILNIHV